MASSNGVLFSQVEMAGDRCGIFPQVRKETPSLRVQFLAEVFTERGVRYVAYQGVFKGVFLGPRKSALALLYENILRHQFAHDFAVSAYSKLGESGVPAGKTKYAQVLKRQKE